MRWQNNKTFYKSLTLFIIWAGLICMTVLACDEADSEDPVTPDNNQGDPVEVETDYVCDPAVADVTPGTDIFFHLGRLDDVDGDGIEDLITVGEFMQGGVIGSLSYWIRGLDTAERFEAEPRLIGEGLGGIPVVIDLDNDGDNDIIAAAYFKADDAGVKEGVAWYERIADPAPSCPAGEWKYHVITTELGPGIELEVVYDLVEEGDRWALFSTHTNSLLGEPESHLYIAQIPEDPHSEWTFEPISHGIESIKRDPGVLAPGVVGHGDIDNDGDIDILLSGDGDPRVFWYEHDGNGAFVQHELEEDLRQASGVKVLDIDGNGTNEAIMTGFENDVIKIYVGVSSAGTQATHIVSDEARGAACVSVEDFNDDGKLDILASQFGRAIEGDQAASYLGNLAIYYQGATLDDWTRETIMGDDDDLFFPAQATVTDLDADGDLDIIQPAGFFVAQMYGRLPSGELFWLENTDTGFEKHNIIKKGQLYPWRP